MKLPLLSPVALIIGMTLIGTAGAQTRSQERGYRYFAPGASLSSKTASTDNALQPTTGLPGAAAAPRQVAPYYGPGVYARRIAQATTQTAPPDPAYASPWTPQAAPGYTPTPGGPTPMYGSSVATPSPGGISSIYSYSGRAYGPYYGNGVQYYSYGGSNGWGSPYNSVYYNSGCYSENACCRASRRLCTPFGGMSYGCGRGCYVVTPPTCPMVCAPYGYSATAPDAMPQTYSPPPTGGAQPQPQPMPPKPEPPTDTPAPPQPSIAPEPQAFLPRVPVFPRIAAKSK